jgi:hypothetical protein
MGMSAPAKNLLMVCEANPSQAGLGRFLSRDALGGLNRYEYCFDNPVNWIDRTGLAPEGGQNHMITGSNGVNTYYNDASHYASPNQIPPSWTKTRETRDINRYSNTDEIPPPPPPIPIPIPVPKPVRKPVPRPEPYPFQYVEWWRLKENIPDDDQCDKYSIMNNARKAGEIAGRQIWEWENRRMWDHDMAEMETAGIASIVIGFGVGFFGPGNSKAGAPFLILGGLGLLAAGHNLRHRFDGSKYDGWRYRSR